MVETPLLNADPLAAIGLTAREQDFRVRISNMFVRWPSNGLMRIVDYIKFLMNYLPGFQGIPERWNGSHVVQNNGQHRVYPMSAEAYQETLDEMHYYAADAIQIAVVAALDDALSAQPQLRQFAEWTDPRTGTVYPHELFLTEAGTRYLAETGAFVISIGPLASARLRVIVENSP